MAGGHCRESDDEGLCPLGFPILWWHMCNIRVSTYTKTLRFAILSV